MVERLIWMRQINLLQQARHQSQRWFVIGVQVFDRYDPKRQ